MRKQNHYSSYRGRRTGLKALIAVVLIVIILVSIGYLIWGDHSLSWSIFPRFDHSETVVESDALPEVELVIEDPQPAVDTTQVGGLMLDVDATAWGDDTSTDFDKLVVTLKDSTGKLNYLSDNGNVVTGAISAYASDNMGYYSQLLAQEVPVSAFVSVLQDPLYASYYVTASALMSTTGFGYKDDNGSVWLDPAKEDAMEWVLAVVDEVIAMGFDEIVLTDFHYPQSGDLETIRYQSDDPAQALTELLGTIYQHTQEAGVSLGMEMSSGSLVSGSVPYEDWTDYVDTFYAVTNDLPTAESLVGAENVTVMAEQVPAIGDYLLVP